MAAVTKGTTLYTWGAGITYSGAKVQSFDIKKSFQLEGEVLNEDGQRVEVYMDDETDMATASLIVGSTFTEPALGATVTLDSVTYWVQSISDTRSNNGFRKVDMELKRVAYI